MSRQRAAADVDADAEAVNPSVTRIYYAQSINQLIS